MPNQKTRAVKATPAEPAKRTRKPKEGKAPSTGAVAAETGQDVPESVPAPEVKASLKATVQQNLLSRYVQIAVEAVSELPTSDLQYLRLEADIEQQVLRVSGFDQAKGVTALLPATVETAGTILCRAAEFRDLIQKLPDTAITLKGDITSIVLVTAVSRSEIQAKSAEGYPKLPTAIDFQSFILDAPVLQHSILKTVNCAELDETKGLLNGVNFQLWKGTDETAQIVTCATNTQVLGLFQTVKSSCDLNQPDGNFTIAQKVIRSLIAIAAMSRWIEIRVGQSVQGESTIVEFACTENSDNAEPQIHRFVASLIEGEFIQYRKYLPQQFVSSVVIDKALILGNLERAKIIAEAKTFKTVMVDVDPEAEELEVFTQTEGVGSHRESISAQITGESIKAVYSCLDLITIAKQVSGTEIRLRFSSSGHLLIDSPTQSEFQGMVAVKKEKE